MQEKYPEFEMDLVFTRDKHLLIMVEFMVADQ